MMSIKHKVENDVPLTPCPHGIDCMVGDIFCEMCGHFMGYEVKYGTERSMNCSHPVKEQYGMVRWHGLDECIIGTVESFGVVAVIAYDYNAMVTHFIKGGMAQEEAETWVVDKYLSIYMGDRTPAIIRNFKKLSEM